MNLYLISLISYWAGVYGVDPMLAVSVAKVESQFNSKAVSYRGAIGLFQIMPATYPNVSRSKLFEPETNIRLGIKYLAWTKKYCSHKEDHTYLVCYNYGIKNAMHVKHPKLFPYYKKVMLVMKEFKKGDKVIVQNLYEHRFDGPGIYIGPALDQHQWKGQHQVLAEGLVMHFELSRLRKDEHE